MSDMVERNGLTVAVALAEFIEQRALPGTGIEAAQLWAGTADIFARFAPENRALLAKRDELQAAIDAWHGERAGQAIDQAEYQAFLRSIGYLVAEPARFAVGTRKVDDEIACLAGPQLVVPVLNARFALNAANARWGSLYDALYGTDAIAGSPAGRGYDAARGAAVIAWAKGFLDEAVPLASGSWSSWRGGIPELADPAQYCGRSGDTFLLRHNGLHIEIVIDAAHPIGRDDPGHIADVVLESALTTIIDLEDSIAAVDAEDKVAAYANWLGLMKGDLSADFEKGGETLQRTLAAGRNWSAAEIAEELDNNAQGILGYVVRWIDQGIGCSKVPDIHDVGLMEDRATLRISSQHMANWLLHGVASKAEADAAFERMAAKVDGQNAGDPLYRPLAGNAATSLAYQAARALVFEGVEQPNGYTEPLLHAFRLKLKAAG
jgi:malate synthase